MRKFPPPLVLSLCLLGASPAYAASEVWLNNLGNSDSNWDTGTNWVSGNVPGVAGAGMSTSDTATFQSAATIEIPTLSADRSIGSISFDNNGADYSLNGSAILSIQGAGGMTFTNGGTTTISPTVRMAVSQTWNTGSTAVTLAGGAIIVGNPTLTLANSTPIVIQGTITHAAAGGSLSFASGSGSAHISANIASSITLNGSAGYTGTVRLSGTNSMTSNLIWRTGTLELNNASALGTSTLQLGTNASSSASRAVTLIPMVLNQNFSVSNGATNGTITLGGTHTSGTTIFNGNLTLNNAAAGLTLTSESGGIVDFAGELTAGIIKKSGTGIVRLTRAAGNTYAGTTTISQGTLLVNNTSGSGTGTGNVSVSSGGTFGGRGSASGAVSINSGGTLAPGDSSLAVASRAGTLDIGGALSFAANSALSIELNGAAAGDGSGFYDQVIAANTVTLSGNVNFTLTLGFDPADNGTQLFTLINNNSVGAIAGSGLLNLNGSTLLAQGDTFTVGGQMFQISYTSGGTAGTFLGGGNDLALLAIPEPSSAALLLGALLLTGARRRRQSQ